MRLTPRLKIQLTIFVIIAAAGIAITAIGYVRVPALLGIGQYTVTVELPESAGLYESANVTYRGTEVGRVSAVRLKPTGVDAVLSLKSGIDIPAATYAEVHSQSAIGEQFVALLPREDGGRALRDGDVIPVERTSVPPDINTLLNDTNTALAAVPGDNLQTVIDESYTALGGLGPDISRLIDGTTKVAIDARANLEPMVNLIDQAQPVLDSQTSTGDSVQAWASNLAVLTTALRNQDQSVSGILADGPGALDEARQLIDRVQPTLPVLLTNLTTLGQVALTYQNSVEQLLVLIPQGTAVVQGAIAPNANTKQDYSGAMLSYNLNINLPPPCTTGFLPATQRRAMDLEDYPGRPAGDVYCRVPQDSMFNVRGARNIPCTTRPGKRSPSVALCESDENYVPLNDGMAWKGDPNATLSGQAVPQLPPAAPPMAVAEYNPANGTYVGPDGQVHTQTNLAHDAPPQTWQSMLLPPTPPT